MKTMVTRVTLGIIIIAIIIGVFWLDDKSNGLVAFSVITLLAMAGLFELYKMAECAGAKPFIFTGVTFTALFIPYSLLINYMPMSAQYTLAPVAMFVLSCFIIAASRPEGLAPQMQNLAVTVFGFLYIALPMLFLGLIRDHIWGWEFLIMVVVISKSTDTGAYFTGTLIGKHKLAPKISPNKTIEGAIGGLVTSAIAAYIAAYFLFNFKSLFGIEMIVTIAVAVFVAAAAQIGDLTESLIKRSTGAKDSSKMLPAFGGVLDMIDSFLVSAPVAWFALVILEHFRGI